MSRISSTVDDAKEVVRVAHEQEITFLAASIAYYAFLSLIPTVLLALVVATTFGGQELARTVVDSSGQFLTESGQEVLESALTGSENAGGATLVSVALLLWGVLKVFRALDTAFSKVYGAESQNSFLDQVVDSLLVIASIGLTMGLMFVVGGALATLRLGVFVELVSVLVLPLLLTGAFVPVYYRFPDTAVTVRETLPGATFAAIGWTVLQGGFQIYASQAGATAYGIVGGVILLVTWLYVAGTVLLLGAVINVVLSDRQRPPEATAGAATPGAVDRQFQEAAGRASVRMPEEREPRGAPDVAELADRVERLQSELEAFEDDVERRTVDRPQLEADLKRYVRRRMRRGKARGWGPYLVLFYGTALTLGAFYWLTGWVAIAAMFVSFTSTLGLYMMFVMFGGVLGAVTTLIGLADRIRSR